MEFLIDNWYIIFTAVAVIAMAGVGVYRYFQKPSGEQKRKIREWLLFSVTEAERILGSGTGQLKLRYVYDLFVMRFPTFVKLITFDEFSDMVDDTLVDMRNLLATNDAVQAHVEGESLEVK